MAFAQVGPLTGSIEALATAIGAGSLLGGFAIGSVGTVLGWPRAKLEKWALPSGHAGGVFAVLLGSVDLAMR
jgi:hypothetical protein